MNAAIRYFTRGGNTKKLAEAISKAVGVPAETVDVPLKEKVDLLFLCSSVYATGVDEKVRSFINGLNPSMVGKIVNVSTAALLPSTYNQVKKLADARGIDMASEEFHCRGQFAMMHRGKPDAADQANAAEFAKKLMKE